MKLRLTYLVPLSALALACNESHTDEADAQIVFDATFPDAGTDSGPPPSYVGTRCAGDDECAAGGPDFYCEMNLGGYCTTFCDETVACPTGSICVSFGGGLQVCLASCEFGSDEDQCPAGNGCSPGGMGLSPVCLPGCEDASDCRAGEECDLEVGFAGAGACFDPSVPVGSACQAREQCGAASDCVDERFQGWPGGYCAGFGCELGSNAGCAEGAACVATRTGATVCLDTCASDTDCRAAYACEPWDPAQPDALFCLPGCTDDSQCTASTFGGTRYVCNPGTGLCDRPFDGSIGQPCTDERQCRGGRCITAADGWPSGMCTYPGCRLSGEGPSATCPAGSVCADDGTGDPDLGVCVPECVDETPTCRDGYTCQPVDPTVADAPTGCLPE